MPSPHVFRSRRTITVAAVGALLLSLLAQPLAPAQTVPLYDHPSDQPVRARHAMVVTIHHDATDAGLEILRAGGNAVDASVAVAFALAVVYPQAGNLGGGGFLLYRPHHGRVHFIDYREKAPAAASRDMYLDAQGNVIDGLSLEGYKASGVPGTVAGLSYAQSHFGRLTWAQDLAPAIRLASDGFILTEQEVANLHDKALTKFPSSAHIFQRDGNFYAADERFTQPLLAKTLRRLAANPADFYHGSIAEEIARDMQAHGGPITTADLAAYQAKDREPIVLNYRGYKLFSAPPPSSGGIVLGEILNILAPYKLARLGPRHPRGASRTPDRSAPQVQLITEAFRRAYMDRADYLGDPDFTPIPVKQLLSPKYAAAWRASIVRGRPTPSADLHRPAGFVPAPPQLTASSRTPAHESPETTHFSVVDRWGNAVANTFTLNNTFGSAVTLEKLGFLMNDEMDDFSSKQGVPNMYGLIQGPANAIGPGKRPLSAMTPTIVVRRSGLMRREQLQMVLGTPGGSTIITTVANDFLSVAENGLNIQQAADAPRFHHQYLPDELDLERHFPGTSAELLANMGYNLNREQAADEDHPGSWGDSELIAVDPHTHELLGGHDSRRNYGKAAGY